MDFHQKSFLRAKYGHSGNIISYKFSYGLSTIQGVRGPVEQFRNADKVCLLHDGMSMSCV